jgi:hypothetical protein
MSTNEAELTLLMKARNLASKEVDRLHSSLTKVKGAAGSAGAGLAKFGAAAAKLAAAALLAVTTGLGLATHHADQYGVTVARVAKITGMATEASSKLVAVFEKYGLEGDAAIRTIGMLQKNVGTYTASAKAAAKFTTQFGFSLKDANGHVKDANTLILQAADYFNNKHIPASQRALLESKLFGRQWQALVPILALGSAGIKEAGDEAAKLGLVLTAQNAGSLAEYHKSTIALNESLGGLQLMLALLVMPALIAVSTWVTSVGIPAIKGIAQSVSDWVTSMKPLIDQLTGFVSGVFSTGIETIVSAFKHLGPAAPIVLGIAAAVGILAAVVMANPIVAIILSIIAIVGVLRTAWERDFGGIRERAQWMFTSFQTGYNTYLKPVVDAIATVITNVVVPAIQLFITWIGNAVLWLYGGGKGPLPTALRIIGDAFGVFRGIVIGVWNWLGSVIARIKDAIGWIADLLKKINSLAQYGNILGNIGGITSGIGGHAEGGWVGLHGPELAVVGEKGPEYVIPNHQLGATGGGGGGQPVVIPIIIDGREVGRIVDEHLYYAINRASPTLARS